MERSTLVIDQMRAAWHLAALSTDVSSKPISRTIAGIPIVLFRTASGIAALIDRCPHRNYPLSRGRVEGGTIVCPYHGWAFATDGACVKVAGCAEATGMSRLSATTVGVTERHGAVYVLLEGDAAFPEASGPHGDPAYDHFWWDQGEWRGTVFDAVENVMDPFHTTEFHHGHIRSRDRRQPVTISVENFERAVETTVEQATPDNGFMARIFERSRTRSRSRFDPPARFQGVWEGRDGINISVLVHFTPTTKGSIRPVACFTTPRGLVPSAIKARVIKAFIAPVVRQDRDVLAVQAETIERFGGPRYAQGPGDPLGGRVRRLMNGETLQPGVTDRFEATL
jgi:phenylpropionate dioxygenase-like ring-hydroxylating dioxygenase large terminal subunit